MEKLTFTELRDYFYAYNQKGGNGARPTNPCIKKAVIVIAEGSFTEKYSLKERSYEVRSDAKAFVPGMISSSIFGDCLDGIDLHIRLDWYIENGWEVEYCYLLEEKPHD